MSSLALLARPATPVPQPFDSTYYSTIATVIPVLFLAFALQSPAYRDLLRGAFEAARDQAAGQSPWHPTGRTATWAAGRLPPSILPRILLTAAFLILTAGFVGEASAVYALYQGHDYSSTRLTVLIATMILIFAVVTGPLLAYIRTTLTLQHLRDAPPGQDGTGPPPSPHPAVTRPEPPEPSTSPAEPHTSETGKTDIES